MLSPAQQKQLVDYLKARPSRGMLKEAFDRSHLSDVGIEDEFDKEREEYAAVIFVDIAGFSGKVARFSAQDVRSYLNDYYAAVIPRIDRGGGYVDRIVGDGVLAVFSSFFDMKLSAADVERRAFDTAREIVQALAGDAHFEAKAAFSVGQLVFCRTGLAGIYEDLTVIGNPITEVYRLEEQTLKKQVLLRADTDFARRHLAGVARQDAQRAMGLGNDSIDWLNDPRDMSLRGVNNDRPVPVLVSEYQK